MKKIIQISFVSILFIILTTHGVVFASEFNFAVNPIIPDNQIDKSKTYFDIKLSPDQTQTLQVQLRNDTDKEVIVEAAINSATTNLNGVVEYGINDIKPDDTLHYNIKDYAKINSEIKVPPKKTISVPIDVKMPKEVFDGVMAGGITFKEKSDENKTKSSEKGLAIKNEYSYVVALLMQQNQNSVEPALNLVSVAASQVNVRNVINVEFQNPVARYLNQLKLVGEITKKNDSSIKYSIDAEGLQMAPNSHFSYPVSLNGKELEPGNYRLKVTAYGNKVADGKNVVNDSQGKSLNFLNKWEFEKEFSISGETAKEYNKKDVSIESNNKNENLLYWIIGLLILIIVILILFLLWKRKKKEDEEKEK